MDGGRADAPMGCAPMLRDGDGRPAWGRMWGGYCAPASEGGPPHRRGVARLRRQAGAGAGDPDWARAAREIARGVGLVTGHAATPAEDGWVAVAVPDPEAARLLAAEAGAEGVESSARGTLWLLPAAAGWAEEAEIRSVVAVAGKCHHHLHRRAGPEADLYRAVPGPPLSPGALRAALGTAGELGR